MSVITAKTEFAFHAPVRTSQPMPASYVTPRGKRGLHGRLITAVQWVAEQPRRRAVIKELQALTDHELADIGLSRVTLHQVFDRELRRRTRGLTSAATQHEGSPAALVQPVLQHQALPPMRRQYPGRLANQ